jgi:hypothetical protein
MLAGSGGYEYFWRAKHSDASFERIILFRILVSSCLFLSLLSAAAVLSSFSLQNLILGCGEAIGDGGCGNAI